MKYRIKAKDKKDQVLYLRKFGCGNTEWTTDKEKAMYWPYKTMAETIALEFENCAVEEIFERSDLERYIVPCCCGAEQLVITGLEKDEIEVSIWQYAYNKDSFWRRFAHAWRAIRHGTPYTDQIVLDKERYTELYKFLRYKVQEG